MEIGKELIECKKEIGHGQWQNWLQDNFKLSYQTAAKFMQVAERFSNVVSIRDLNSTQLITMLALPEGEEEKFIETKKSEGKAVEDMTIKKGVCMKIEIGIEPLPQSRIRFANGRAYEESRIKSYKEEVSVAAKIAMKGSAPITTPLSVVIKLYRKIKVATRRFGDLDNHCKAILDALNGIVFCDDAQVVSLTAQKFYSEVPRLEIEIETA